VSYDKPVPVPSTEDREFWDATRRHVLTLPHCQHCGHIWFPPFGGCPRCLHTDHGWVVASGRGEVFAFTVFERPYIKAFAGDVPYHVALIRLDEGPLIYGNLVDVPHLDVRVGMKVEVIFDNVTDTLTLPRFRSALP
jgi:uncharacterized OB-fold protein